MAQSSGKGNGLKIALVVILLAAAGGIYWYTSGGGNKQPPNAADNVSDEVKKMNAEAEKEYEKIPEEVIGGS